MVFQNVKHLLSYKADLIQSLEVSLTLLSLQIASSLISSSLRFWILAALAMLLLNTSFQIRFQTMYSSISDFSSSITQKKKKKRYYMEALLKVTWQKLLYLTATVLTPWEGWGGEGQKNKKV